MDFLQILILALVQALTEFLPVSSSGHLVLASEFFGWVYQGLAFDVALHVGTLAAVAIYFRRDLASLAVQGLKWRPGAPLDADQRLLVALAIGTIPGGIAGLAMGEEGAMIVRQLPVIAAALIVFGLLLGWADRRARASRTEDDYHAPASAVFGDIGFFTAFLIGCAQALALIPGTSRSGVTMTAALLLGLSRAGAARYAFLLSVPIMILAGLHGAWELVRSGEGVHWGDFALGMVISAAAGVVVIHFFLRVLRRVGTAPFVIYRVALGAFVLVWVALKLGE